MGTNSFSKRQQAVMIPLGASQQLVNTVEVLAPYKANFANMIAKFAFLTTFKSQYSLSVLLCFGLHHFLKLHICLFSC